MSVDHQWVPDLSVVTAADLSTNQFQFVRLDANDKLVLADAAGQSVLGILQNKPKLGEAAAVRCVGISLLEASGALASNALVATTAAGLAKAAVAGSGDPITGSNVAAKVVRGVSNAGELLTVLITQSGAIPTNDA